MRQNESSKSDLNSEIEQLQRDYRDSLHEKCRTLDELFVLPLQALNDSRWTFNLDQWKAGRDFIHKIAGSSGTYGFVGLSEALRFMENRIMDGSLRPLTAKDLRAFYNTWRVCIGSFVDRYTALAKEGPFSNTLRNEDQTLQSRWRQIENDLLLQMNTARARHRSDRRSREAA